jgi:hypothetical protein
LALKKANLKEKRSRYKANKKSKSEDIYEKSRFIKEKFDSRNFTIDSPVDIDPQRVVDVTDDDTLMSREVDMLHQHKKRKNDISKNNFGYDDFVFKSDSTLLRQSQQASSEIEQNLNNFSVGKRGTSFSKSHPQFHDTPPLFDHRTPLTSPKKPRMPPDSRVETSAGLPHDYPFTFSYPHT